MPRLTLTFDNGPTPGITDRVLDALAAAGVQATFFLVGTELEKPGGRALAEQARAAGHWLGNHSYTHGEPLGLRPGSDVAAHEISAMNDLMGDLVDDRVLFRPNGKGRIGPHLLSPDSVAALATLKASIVLWTSVPKDRAAVVARPDSWLAEAREAVLAADWTLMVLHDRPSGFDGPGPMAFLPAFLDWAKDHADIVQQFPPDCVPMHEGRWSADPGRYVAA